MWQCYTQVCYTTSFIVYMCGSRLDASLWTFGAWLCETWMLYAYSFHPQIIIRRWGLESSFIASWIVDIFDTLAGS